MSHNSYSSPSSEPPRIESVPTTNALSQSSGVNEERFGIEIRPDGAEFHIDNISYNYLGRTDSGYMEFTSISADGPERSFLVYVSRSEGSLRVSQGREVYQKDGKEHIRLMKGPELSPRSQYTQDTQLHPKFDEKVGRLEEIRELRYLPARPTPLYDSKGVEWFLKDFDVQTETYPLGSGELNDQLMVLKVSSQSIADIKKITGLDPLVQPDLAEAAYMHRIDILNATLESSGIMPDFSEDPTSAQVTNHPLLGDMIRETFNKTVGGKTYEWHMARDRHGRVWIERIRFADAEPTVYGTDKQMVYSGLLTSKPIDYKDQVDGLPSRLTQDMGNDYMDITRFLKKLAPIREYSRYCYRRDQDYIFVAAA